MVSYFFFNIFIGVMFSCFHDAYTQEKSKGLEGNKPAEKWYDLLTQIEQSKPEWEGFIVPDDPFRLKIYNMMVNIWVDNLIMTIIILNLVTMAMNFENQSDLYNTILDDINLAFTSIFILEAFLKLIAFGFTRYFNNSWNRFDFFVVVASSVEIAINYYFQSYSSFQAQFLRSFQVIRVLRVLRVTR